MESFHRLECLIGHDGLCKLQKSNVLILGLGGVGSYVAESLVRSAVGKMTIVDGDVVEKSNLNRQLFATTDTVGMLKVDAAKHRLLSVNPLLKIKTLSLVYDEKVKNVIDLTEFDYVVDAVDDLNAKVLLAQQAYDLNVNLISAMSAGNKLNSCAFEVADVFETSVCPIAKIMRRKLKKLGVSHLKVVYSKEKPRKFIQNSKEIGSAVFVTAVMGLILTNEVIKGLLVKQSV